MSPAVSRNSYAKNKKIVKQHSKEHIEAIEDKKLEKSVQQREKKQSTYRLIRFVWLGTVIFSIFFGSFT